MTHPDAPAGGTPDDASPSSGGELERLRAEAAFHQRLRDLTVAFSRDVSSPATIGHALEAFATEANALLGAARTAIWLHERREHRLTLSACSDAGRASLAASVATSDADAPPARGLRLDRPAFLGSGADAVLVVPLRGWRRAIGTLVADGPFSPGFTPDQLTALSLELARQLSAAIENVQLIQEILRQRRLLEDSFNSLADLVLVLDPELRVVQSNDAFAARAGLSRAELLDRPLETLVGPGLAAWVAEQQGHVRQPEDPPDAITQRLEDPRLGGTFVVTLTTLINHAGERAGRVLVVRDITEQARLEREREALSARLAQSEKLASLGQFVAGIAHEMNNPLQGVLGHLELMIRTEPAAKSLRKDLRRIHHEADRAARIVRNLLVFTGGRRMTRRRLQMPKVIERAVSSRATAFAAANIEIVRDDAADLPAVSGDPLQLHQALLNLLVNAEHAITDAGHDRGRITIRTSASPDGSTVLTTVHDSGPGIPDDVLPRIFDPFFTTKDVGKGTGLGLAITYGIVQEHRGAIYARTAPEGGALFTIELPAVRRR